jgi:hypothetical protein
MSKKIDRPKCEPGYRYLNKGEIVRKTDSFVNTDDFGSGKLEPLYWSTPRTAVGFKVGTLQTDKMTYRRKLEPKKVKAAPPKVEVPVCASGYRWLEKGEIVKGGDECVFGTGKVEPSVCIGEKFDPEWWPVRRKLEVPVTASPAQKYRPLKEDEKLEAGDEIYGYMNDYKKAWAPIHSMWVGEVVGSKGYKGWEYRRKVPADYKYEHPKVKPVDGMYCLPVIVTDKTSRFYGVTGRAVAYNYPTDKKAYLVAYDTPQEKEGFTEGWFWGTEVFLYKKPEPEYRFLKYGEVLLPTDEQVLGFQASDDKPIWGGISPVFFTNKNLELAVGEFDAKFKKFRRKVE